MENSINNLSGDGLVDNSRMLNLMSYGFKADEASYLFASDSYFESVGFKNTNSYLLEEASKNVASVKQLRDEMYVYLCFYMSTVASMEKLLKYEKGGSLFLEFGNHVLLMSKSIIQTVFSIDRCLENNCYSDAFVLIRTLITKQNVTALISLNPRLEREWISRGKELDFRDGLIRKELANHELEFSDLFYEEFSELVHGNVVCLLDYGYLDAGMSGEIIALKKKGYSQIKFTLAPLIYFIMAMSKQFQYKVHKDLIDCFFNIKSILEPRLSPGRLENLQNVVVEERNWEKIGKDKMRVSPNMNYENIFSQIEKFHRPNQPKKLNKPYS